MNRCTPSLLMPHYAQRVMLVVALLGASATALAQMAVRPFPATAQRGSMQVSSPPDLVMNGQAERFSPGARIRDANNMLVLSAALTGQTLLVNFVREPQGLIHEVWILNAAEAQARQP